MSSDEVCDLYKCSRETLKRYIKAGLPFTKGTGVGTPRIFDAQQVAEFFKANPVKGAHRPDAVGGDAKAEWDAAKIREKVAAAKLKEIKIEEAQGRLITKAEVERLHIALAAAVRTRFLALPSVSPALEGRTAVEIQGELELQVRSILKELSVL